MGRESAGPPDRLTILGDMRSILDAIATGGIIPSQGYERMRRLLLEDAELRSYLPDWLGEARTTEEAKSHLIRSGRPLDFVRESLARAFAFLEEGEFSPQREQPRRPTAMHCPHCTIAMSPVRERFGGQMFYKNTEGEDARVEAVSCPQCGGIFLIHTYFETKDGLEPGTATWVDRDTFVLWPRVSSRKPVPPEVPEQYASLAREAALILQDSPRGSAALSRRCLQQLLRNEAKAPPGSLYSEIEWVLRNGDLPSRATRSLHSLREIGNMAAHPNTGPGPDDYLDVEPGEADWTLDVIDDLFDQFFVSPALEQARRAALDAKLGRSR
jgi:hypothetical protein